MSRRVILFNSLDHARAAAAAARELDVPLTLRSAPGAAAYAGVGFLKAAVDQAAGGAFLEWLEGKPLPAVAALGTTVAAP